MFLYLQELNSFGFLNHNQRFDDVVRICKFGPIINKGHVKPLSKRLNKFELGKKKIEPKTCLDKIAPLRFIRIIAHYVIPFEKEII